MEDGHGLTRHTPNRASKGRCKMLQTSYGKNGAQFSIDVPPDFQAELDALSPRMAYCAEYGIKQSVADAYAAKGLSHSDIIGKGLKKWDAIVAGTVRVAGSGERTPTKTPMEREVWKIAAQALAELFTKKKVPKDRQATYIRLKVERDWDELVEQARENLAKVEAIKPDAFAALDELYAEDDEEEAEAAE